MVLSPVGLSMSERILITGGAGFIGRHLASALLAAGKRVRVLDCLVEQVHGAGAAAEPLLDPAIEFIAGDVRDRAAVAGALQGVDAVVHLAAEVGVGQSMYAIERYVSVNELGTAILLECLLARRVRRIVVASSMSIYGEGLYRGSDGRLVEDAARCALPAGSWDPVDAEGRRLTPVPTPEWKRPALASIYAINKYVQERMILTTARAYGMEAVALRLWNVYGPGQALSNPYTGVLAIFASRLLNGRRPLVFEDGRQMRDFVHVSDVAAAFRRALDEPAAAGRALNIASGESLTIVDVAQRLAAAMGYGEVQPEISGQARAGDVRHCIPDISAARSVLGFAPEVAFRDGIAELADWLRLQRNAEDRVPEARQELERRGLVA